MKKLIAFGAGAGLLLAAAVPVFANGDHGRGGSSDVAIVRNSASAGANTGYNSQGNTALIGGQGEVEDVTVGGNNDMTTGNADAYAGALVVANTHIGCGCESRGHKDFALVDNSAEAGADTGDNGQGNAALIGGYSDSQSLGGGDRDNEVEDITVNGNNTMTTGDASATSRAWTIVNTHMSWGD